MSFPCQHNLTFLKQDTNAPDTFFRHVQNLDESGLVAAAPRDADSERAAPGAVFNALSLSWLLGIYLVSSAIFIPKTLFVRAAAILRNTSSQAGFAPYDVTYRLCDPRLSADSVHDEYQGGQRAERRLRHVEQRRR